MMDAKEAIKIIEANYPPNHYTMLREALSLAIAALERHDKYKEALMQFKYDYEQGVSGAEIYMDTCKLLKEE